MRGATDSVQTSQFAAEAWLQALEFPRPNGTASLDSAHSFLQSSLAAAGLDPLSLPYDCHPDRDLAVALALLLSACVLGLAAWRHSRGLATLTLGLWIVAAAMGTGSMDFLLPSSPQASLLVTVDSIAPKQHEILILAHYDSKTQPLDHVARSILYALAIVVCSLTWAPLLLRRGPRPWLVPLALTALLSVTAQLSLGRWLPARSAGIVDDAGACVLLAELATELQEHPLRRTRVQFLWTSGEEVGAQGAAAFVKNDVSAGVDRFINLEGIGTGPDLVDAGWELGGWHLHRAHDGTRSHLRTCSDTPLRSLRVPLWSDAGPLRQAGLFGVTLLNLESGAETIRGLHGPQDRLERFDWSGYTRVQAALRCTLEAMDRQL